MRGNSWRHVCMWVTKSLDHLHDSFMINVLLFEEQLAKYGTIIPLQLWIFLPQNSWVYLSCLPHLQLWPYCFYTHFVFCPPSGVLTFFTRVSGNRQLQYAQMSTVMGVEKLTHALEFTNYMISFKGFAECHPSKLQREYCVVLYDIVSLTITLPHSCTIHCSALSV